MIFKIAAYLRSRKYFFDFKNIKLSFQFLGNFLSIVILYRRDMDLKPMFRQILITLISFDIFCIIFNLLLFSMPHLSDNFMRFVFPYIVPYVLPLAQIALTGQLFTVSQLITVSQFHSRSQLITVSQF